MTKRGKGDKIIRLSGSEQTVKIHGEILKNFFKKLLKKVLTKGKSCDIITKLSTRDSKKSDIEN